MATVRQAVPETTPVEPGAPPKKLKFPTAYDGDTPAAPGRRLAGVEAVIDKDLASALLAIQIGADALAIVTDVDAVYADWGTSDQRPIRSATPEQLAGSAFTDTQALLRGEAGTRVALDAATVHAV